MTAYDNIRAATSVAEQEHNQTVQDLADANDTIEDRDATITARDATIQALEVDVDALEATVQAQHVQIAQLQADLAECEDTDPPDPPTGDDLDSLLRPPAGKLLLGVQQESGGYTGWLAENGNKAPHIFHRYSTSGSTFVSALNSTPTGMIPLVNFKPTGGMGLSAYNSIVAGNANAAIDQAANACKTYGKPLFVAIMHEPENDGTASDDPEYVAAYRHTALRMRGIAPNIVFVWNMMGAPVHGSRYNGLYPGDDVVDWIGLDPYIQTSTTVDTWNELVNQTATGFSGFYNWAKPKGKPIMLCEWGIGKAVVAVTGAKMFGNTEMANLVNNLPLLKALVYWNDAGIGGYQVSNPGWTGSGATGMLGTWVRRAEFQVDISDTAK